MYLAGVGELTQMHASPLQIQPENSTQTDYVRAGQWDLVAPNPALAPAFQEIWVDGTRRGLRAEGNGRRECYGYLRCTLPLDGGRSYKLRVRLEAEGLEPMEHHLIHGIYGEGYSGGISRLESDGREVFGQVHFDGPATPMEAELRLHFRHSAHGRVTWKEAGLEECDPIAARPVTFACHEGSASRDVRALAEWAAWLDRAGMRPDLVLLPEAFDGATPLAAHPPHGPAAALLQEKARQWGMYTCGTFYETRGDLIFNTAPLFDRTGKLVGSYDKFLPFEHELNQGVSPGAGLDVFETDLGRLAVMTCYDSWFPQVARELARQCAEIVLVPNTGYFEELMAARAADNQVCVVASSLNHPAGVWGSSGARAGEPSDTRSRESPSAILSVARDYADGMLLVTIDLSKRYSPHWKGGSMESAPAARACRVTSLRPFPPSF